MYYFLYPCYSVVTSVSVVMETNNGKHTYYADAVGQPLSKPNIASQVASPINLLNPDRYEFYTFNDDGELVKRLMTLKEIQGIIAGGDSESAGYNSAYNPQMPNPDNDVTNVVENVQNVLKEEIEAHKNPMEGKPILDTPDVSANWNLILPAIFGDTMMSDAITMDESHQPAKNDGNSDDSSTEYMKLSSRTPDAGENNDFEQNLLSQSSTQMDMTTDHLLQENTQTFVTEPKIEAQNNMPSTSLFSTWFGSTSTKSVPTQEATPVLTSTESIMEPISEETISSTSIKNVEHKVTNEPTPVTEKVSEINPTFDENKPTPQQYVSTGEFTDSTTISTTTSLINKTQENEDKITTMALISEKTSTPVPVTETSTSKSASTLTQTTTETIEFPKITELVSMITRPTTKGAEKTTPTTTVQTSVTFPHSSQFTHSTELLPSSTEKPLTNDAEKIDNPSLVNNEAINNNDNQNLNINTAISTENINNAVSAVTETAAILNTIENDNVNLTQNTMYQPTESNMNDNILNYSTSTEYGIVADIDQLIANISEEIITKNENIPVENYNVSEIIQQILNYPTNASEIINQTITLASLIVDSNREPVTTESILKDNTASALQSTTMDNNDAIVEKQATATPVLVSSTTVQTTASTTEVTTPQVYETVSTTEKLRTPEIVETTMDNSKSTTDILQPTTELLKTTPAVLPSSLSTSTPIPTDITTKLTTQNIPKTPSQTPSTVNVPTVQPTTIKIETVQVTTPSSTTLENSEFSPSTILQVTEEEMVTNKIAELSNTPEVLEDKSTISTTQIPTSIINYITNNNIKDQTSQSTTNAESTTVKSTTPLLSNTVLKIADIKTENIVTKDDKTTEQPKISTTLITKMPTTNMVTQKSTEFGQPSTVLPTTRLTTRSPVPVSTTTVSSVTKAAVLSTITTRHKTIPPSTTTTVNPVTTSVKTVTTTAKPITTTSKPVTSYSIPVTTTTIPVTTSVKPTITTGKPVKTNDIPVTTSSKPITTTNISNKTTNGISNISEPYRRTEDILPGKTPGDTWKLVQTVQPPQISSNKKHNTTISNRHTTEKPNLEPYQPVINIDMSAQGTFGMPVLSEDMAMFSKMYNELALKFWNALSVKDISSDRSATVSPFGAISMLAMIFLGARGGTSGEMNDVLKLDDIVTFNPHLVFKEVTESVVARKSLSAIVRELYTDGTKGRVHDFYKERVRQFYDGHVEEVDFKRINNVIRRRTNALINKQTRGQMPQYLAETTLTLKAPLSALSTNIFQVSVSIIYSIVNIK